MTRYYRFRYYRGFTVSRNSFEARRIVIATLLKTNVWYLLAKPNQRKRLKHPNRAVNLQVFVKTAINSNIMVFFHTIYRALKLQYHPALPVSSVKYLSTTWSRGVQITKGPLYIFHSGKNEK